jgi:hypothetical protein
MKSFNKSLVIIIINVGIEEKTIIERNLKIVEYCPIRLLNNEKIKNSPIKNGAQITVSLK